MKKTALLIALPLLSMTLTSCQQSVKEEKFISMLDEVKTTLSSDDERLKDVKIYSNLNTEVYNYKEGEYYSYKMFALIIIVPITQGDYVWKEDGKYYHAETHTDSKKDRCTEITEEVFLSKMVAYKEKILNKLSEPLNTTYELMEGTDKYESIKNHYQYDSLEKTYIFTSQVENKAIDESGSEILNKSTITIKYKNGLPILNRSKGESTSKWTYSYGKSELVKPSIADQETSES